MIHHDSSYSEQNSSYLWPPYKDGPHPRGNLFNPSSHHTNFSKKYKVTHIIALHSARHPISSDQWNAHLPPTTTIIRPSVLFSRFPLLRGGRIHRHRIITLATLSLLLRSIFHEQGFPDWRMCATFLTPRWIQTRHMHSVVRCEVCFSTGMVWCEDWFVGPWLWISSCGSAGLGKLRGVVVFIGG